MSTKVTSNFTTGGQFTAAHANEIKGAINENGDLLDSVKSELDDYKLDNDASIDGLSTSIQGLITGKANQSDLSTLQTLVQNVSTGKADQSVVNTILGVLGMDSSGNAVVDGDAIVNKLNEVLTTFQNFPEATNLYSTLQSKFDTSSFATTQEAVAGTNNQKPVNPALVKAMIEALTPVSTLQSETTLYVSRLAAKGSILAGSEVAAIDQFFAKGKTDGWLPLMKLIWLPFGSNLASSLVNLYNATGVAAELVNNNFVEADYSRSLGFGTGTGANTNKFLGTGIVPANLGLNRRDISINVFIPDESAGTVYGLYAGMNPATGTNPLVVESASIVINQTGGSGGATGITQYAPAFVGASYGPGNRVIGYINGVNGVNSSTTVIPDTPLDTEITFFKGMQNGSAVYGKGKSSFKAIGSFLNELQSKSLQDAEMALLSALGRYNNKGSVCKPFGDSITMGQGASLGSNRWATIFCRNIAHREVNLGVASSQLRQDVSGIAGGYQRYSDADNIASNTEIIMYGTNDLNNNDNTSTGDTTKINDYKTKLTEIANKRISQRVRVILASPPWNGVSTTPAARRNAWQNATLEVAKTIGVDFADMETVFTDTGNPGSYFPDTLHPNNAGHALIADLATAVYFKRPYRKPVLDFPSIAAGASADLTVTMGNAKVGNLANVTCETPTAGIIYSASVSAADTVTVRATNITGSAIDPASAKFNVTVFI